MLEIMRIKEVDVVLIEDPSFIERRRFYQKQKKVLRLKIVAKKGSEEFFLKGGVAVVRSLKRKRKERERARDREKERERMDEKRARDRKT